MHVGTLIKNTLFIQVLQDRAESLTKQIQDLEGKAQSLQLTIDRLSTALTRTEEEENQQKEKVNQSESEPPHDKTNKVTVRPAKTQIILGIRPV